MASIHYRGALQGHSNWVTSIATTFEQSDLLVSASRDKTAILWTLDPEANVENGRAPGYARRALRGHNQGVQDAVISSDGQFALTGSEDKTIRLWDLGTGECVRTFKGHTSDVNSVAFSADNRQIVSGSRDHTIKLWNTLAECKFTITQDCHTDWITSVKFSPSAKNPLIVSAGYDKLIKVWSLNNCRLKTNLAGHTGVLYSICISPDGSLCASGGKDSTIMLWDVNEGKHLYSLDGGSTVYNLTFSPRNYWLCAATDSSIKIWDLENKSILEELWCKDSEGSEKKEKKKSGIPWVVSLQWSADGNTLFAGSTDGNIYVYGIGARA